MIKIFREGRGGDTFKTPSLPTNNFCLYPPPILRCFWKDPLMTPTTPLQAPFTAPPTPHPPPLPPLKILIIHQALFCQFISLSMETQKCKTNWAFLEGFFGFDPFFQDWMLPKKWCLYW